MASPTLPPPPTPTLFDATLPPSAPSPSADSSSPRRRQHPPHHHKQHKHHAADRDPFADLPDASSQLCAACAAPAEGSDAPPAPDEPSSLFNTLFYTPVAVTSFVLSLTLVDYRNRSYRAAEHVSPSSAPSSRASTWAQRVGGAFAGPEPYRDGYERREGGSGGGDGEKHSRDGEKRSERERERERWVARKKHRAMAKMELGDALELRGRVALAVVAAVVLTLLAVLWWLKAVLGRLVLR